MQVRKVRCGGASHTVGTRSSLSFTAATIGSAAHFPVSALCFDIPVFML